MAVPCRQAHGLQLVFRYQTPMRGIVSIPMQTGKRWQSTHMLLQPFAASYLSNTSANAGRFNLCPLLLQVLSVWGIPVPFFRPAISGKAQQYPEGRWCLIARACTASP